MTELYTIFHDFIYDCQGIKVIPGDKSYTQSLTIAMSALYKHESAQVDAIGKVF